MNRTQQLKLLSEEIRRMFSEGTSERDAFNQLQSDSRFGSVRRVSVQSLFQKLQNDVDKQAKKKEVNEQKHYRQNATNLLLYENQSIKKKIKRFKCIWEDRYYLVLKSINGNERTFKMTDFYQNVSKEVSLLVGNRMEVTFYALNGQFGLMKIWNNMNWLYSVHLVYIDVIEGKLELVQEVKRDERRFPHIFVDSVDRSKFVMAFFGGQRVSVVACSLSGGRFNVGEEVVFLENYEFIHGDLSYFNNQLLGLTFENGHFNDFNHANIFVQDLTGEKRRNILRLEPLPSNVQVPDECSFYRWFCDHVFMPIQFCSTDFYGIAFTEPQTRKWSILEFAINLQIISLTFVDNCNLLAHGGKFRQENGFFSPSISKVYKLPLRKPESLRFKAWLKTIAWFKKQNADDPYKEARKFLPLTSELHCPFNADEHENAGQE